MFIVLIAAIMSFGVTTGSAVLVTTSTLYDLLNQVKKLTPTNQRVVAAVVGSAVADAATRPFHWLYDRAKLEAIIGDKDPAFWPMSMSPYYTLPTGRRSCYNDLAFCMLQSMGPFPQTFDEGTYVKSMSTFFGPDSEYAAALKLRKEVYTPAKRLEDREPTPGPWQQGAVTNFLTHVESGAHIAGSPESKETDGLCTTIPLICRLAAEEVAFPDTATDQDEVIVKAAKLLSSNPFALRHTLAASRILRSIVVGGAAATSWDALVKAVVDDEGVEVPGGKTIATEGGEEVDYLRAELEQVHQALMTQEGHTDAVERWGRQCANPGSFQGALLAVSSSSGFAEGIRKVIKGGGCNCSRSNFAGACLGAAYGFETVSDDVNGPHRGIPLRWLEQCDQSVEILRMAIEKVAVCRNRLE